MINLLRFPDVISMLNGFFGLSAILLIIFNFSIASNLLFHLAFTFILLGLLADGLDGILARRFGKGNLGMYFEAMSDMTTMGIAPSVFIAMKYMSHTQNNALFSLMLWFVLLFYVCCAFIRLASFHPLKNKKVFLGVPASAATMFLLSISFLTNSFVFILIAILIAACLMIMPFPFPKPSKIMNAVTLGIIILTIIFGFFFKAIYFVLPISVLVYLIGGQFYLHYSREMI